MELSESRCCARTHRPEDGRSGTGHEGGLSPPEAACRPGEEGGMRRAAAGEKVREPEKAEQTTESGKVGETVDGRRGGVRLKEDGGGRRGCSGSWGVFLRDV